MLLRRWALAGGHDDMVGRGSRLGMTRLGWSPTMRGGLTTGSFGGGGRWAFMRLALSVLAPFGLDAGGVVNEAKENGMAFVIGEEIDGATHLSWRIFGGPDRGQPAGGATPRFAEQLAAGRGDFGA